MKKILCFGDSNTFGFMPESGRRYDKNTRWTGVLAELVKNKYEVIEAGCNNRTCYVDNPYGIAQTGYKILPTLLDIEIDTIILMIGLNDLQFAYNRTIEDIKEGIEHLIKIIKAKQSNAKIILAAPSHIKEQVLNGYFANLFDKTAIESSKQFSPIYKEVANKYSCKFIDLNDIVQASDIDGLHYDKESHKIIAEAMFKMIY